MKKVVAILILVISQASFAIESKKIDLSPSPIPNTYPDCSPYLAVGELCVWRGGVEIPIYIEGNNSGVMSTLVLPPTNNRWTLYKGELNIRLEYILDNNCSGKFSIFYNSNGAIYNNSDVCYVR